MEQKIESFQRMKGSAAGVCMMDLEFVMMRPPIYYEYIINKYVYHHHLFPFLLQSNYSQKVNCGARNVHTRVSYGKISKWILRRMLSPHD
jgi:hypothetical protein